MRKKLDKLISYLLVAFSASLLVLVSGCVNQSNVEAQSSHNLTSTDEIKVVMKTTLGDVEFALYRDKAPVTVNNFLRYIDSGLFNGGKFYRVVRPDNDNGSPKITVVQGGVADEDNQFPPIIHETTQDTGILHLDGTLSMARLEPGTANSDFFICVGAQPALDFGGKRNPDLQGFAAFGRVTKGMEIVRQINRIRDTKQDVDPYLAGQMLKEPVKILQFKRL